MEVPVCLAPENSRMPESEVAVAEAAFEGEAAVMAFFMHFKADANANAEAAQWEAKRDRR
jgi:hypothetical protein